MNRISSHPEVGALERVRSILAPALRRLSFAGALAAGMTAGTVASTATAQLLLDEHPAEELGTDVIERRGERIDLNLTFRDSTGAEVALGDYVDGELPVALPMGYYDCPLLCTRLFNGAVEGFKELGFTLGEDYRAVTVSIDHTDSTAQAAGKKAAMLDIYGRSVEADAWAFLTGEAGEIRQLADQVGFQYRYLPKSGEFSHPAVMVILSPEGVVSNYLYGVDFPAKQLRLALVDAGEGKIGSLFDRVLLFCHVYDPSSGSFTLQAFRVMQVGGGMTAALVLGGVGALFIAERVWRRRKDQQSTSAGAAPEAGRRGEESRWRRTSTDATTSGTDIEAPAGK